MAGSVNKVIVIGHLGANPEIKYLPSGQPVCEMRIATSETYRDRNDQPAERTEWHRIVVWGKTAENCAKFLTKGQQVYVEGRLQTRSWDDKDGNKRYIKGPDVVFPEPTERFVEKNGSRKFKAIELNEISGIYLKVIAPYSAADAKGLLKAAIRDPNPVIFLDRKSVV